MNLAAIDLNLLVVFDALVRARSVTTAARALSLIQPAVSHALNRLRRQLDAPLFVRGRDGLVPTPRAIALASDVSEILAAIGRALDTAAFDPRTTRRDFRLAGSDYVTMTLFPRIVSALRAKAPYARIVYSHVDQTVPHRLETGALDVAFYGVEAPPRPIISTVIFQEHFVGLVCRSHPLARKARRGLVSLDDYVAFPHAVASLPTSTKSPVDLVLSALGRSRTTSVISPNFTASIAAARGSDLILSMPSRLSSLPACQGLVPFELPLAVPDYAYLLAWHRCADDDPAARWLRDVIIDVADFKEPKRVAL